MRERAIVRPGPFRTRCAAIVLAGVAERDDAAAFVAELAHEALHGDVALMRVDANARGPAIASDALALLEHLGHDAATCRSLADRAAMDDGVRGGGGAGLGEPGAVDLVVGVLSVKGKRHDAQDRSILIDGDVGRALGHIGLDVDVVGILLLPLGDIHGGKRGFAVVQHLFGRINVGGHRRSNTNRHQRTFQT